MWTREDEEQAAGLAAAREVSSDTCTQCGDGTRPGHELYDGCETSRARQTTSRIPEDSWRRSVLVPRRRRY